MGKLDGRSVLITGASAGIGAAAACTLAAEGARLALVARRADLLDEVAISCRSAGSPEVRTYPTDLADLDAAERVALAADDDLGGIDVCVNNAGMPKRLNVAKLAFSDVETVMRLNYLSPVRIVLALLPRMTERGGGIVVNVGSMAARIPSPQEAAYTASKHALAGFTEVAQVDLAGSGVSFRMVQPGPIDTPIWDEMEGNDSPLYTGPKYPAEDVAAVILEAITGTRFEYVVPENMRGLITAMNDDIESFFAMMIRETTR